MVKFFYNLYMKVFCLLTNRRVERMLYAVEEIKRKGTRIVSFDYYGTRRNVLIGADIAEDFENNMAQKGDGFVKLQPKDVCKTKYIFLAGVENNVGLPRPVRLYNMRKIKNPCAVLRGV